MSTNVNSEKLVEFVGVLREHGVEIGTSDTVDAAAATVVLGQSDRDRLRSGLAATLLRRPGQREVFDRIFALFYDGGEAVPLPPSTDVTELREMVVDAISDGDTDGVATLAEQVLDSLGAIGGEGSSGSGRGEGRAQFSAYQTFQKLGSPDELAKEAQSQRGSTGDDTRDAVFALEAERRAGEFRALVEAEALRRVARIRGAKKVAKSAVRESTEDRAFLSANQRDLAEMRRLVYPLARTLATRVSARRRKATRGRIDMRRTVRKSMGTGGIPMRPVLQARRHGRPDLIILADMSGSVAGFAEFTLMLVQAMQDQFTKVRSFGFVDSCDEITHIFRPGEPPTAGFADRVVAETDVARFGGSNYGTAFAAFGAQYLDAIGPRSSVLILGDARTNYADPNVAVLQAMRARAKNIFWLNPEPARSWSSGDSAAHTYAEVVSMYETGTVRQLADVVGRLLPT
ncbi:VWA domain-containing protein [Rhodococcus sp. NPDC058521]|uniref:vWA domain-containing protein n=1 Tax=Rhodococcus sp. NPDC058521 TaxID=3346536 RepID=UPI003663226E